MKGAACWYGEMLGTGIRHRLWGVEFGWDFVKAGEIEISMTGWMVEF